MTSISRDFAVFMFRAEKEIVCVPKTYLKGETRCAWPLNCKSFLDFKSVIKKHPSPPRDSNWNYFEGKIIRTNLTESEAKNICLKARTKIRTQKTPGSDFSFQSGSEEHQDGELFTRSSKKNLSGLHTSRKVRMELLPTPPPLKKSKRRENQLKTDSNAFAEKDGACLSAEVEFEEMIIEHAQSLDDTPPNPIPTPSSIPALSNTDIDEDDCPPTNNEACHDKEPTASPQSVSGDLGGFNLMTLDKYSNEGVVPKCTTEDYQGTVLKNFELVKNKLASNGLALESLFTLYDQLRINLSNNAHEESTTKPVEDESFGLELPLKGPDEFDQLEKNLEDKSFYKKLVKATQKHILKVGLKLSGSKEAKIKKCIEATVMPWYFSPSLVKVSSKAGQGEKNIVKIAGTLFVSMIADAINVVAKDGIASREFVECVMGEYLRRVGSKLRQSVSAPKSVDRRKASFSPHKKTPLKKSSHVKKVKPVSLLLKLTTSPLSTPTKKRHEDLDASSNRTENSSEEIDSESHHASGSENDVSLSDTELRFSS